MSMKITINRLHIKDNPANEVTSNKIFMPRKIKDDQGNYLYHPEGIFSSRIFGRIGSCKCGNLTKPGYCPICDTRVVNKNRMPDFYIKFDNVDIPFLDLDTSTYPQDAKLIKALFNYEGFLYDGEYVEYNLRELDLTQFDPTKVLIGKDAILSLDVDEEWYNNQVTNKLYVPHTSLRKVTIQNDHYFLGTLNTILLDILKYKIKLDKSFKNIDKDIFFELSLKRLILEKIKEAYHELFMMIAKNKTSLVTREIRGQGLTGIIRAVITNNFSLDEDYVLIGKYFIKTLYPKFYEEYTKDGVTDVAAINERLQKEGYYVLVNRQPTIGAKSIMGMHPLFSDRDDEKYVIQLNPIVMEGFAGDFDGDVLAVIALYSKEACQEAKVLLPSKNYIEGSNGSIRNGLVEDFLYVMQKMYNENNADEINEIIK